MTQENVINLKNLLLILRKHLLPIALVTGLSGLSCFLVAKVMMRPVYEASAQLIVSVPADTTGSATQSSLQLSQQLVSTYSILLKSDSILGDVRQNLGLSQSVGRLSQEVTVKGVGTTQIMNLSVRDTSPAVAAEIANEIIRLAPDEISRTVNVGTVAVVSPVQAGTQPVSPNVPMITLAGLITGMLVSGFFVVLIDLLNDRFRSVSDIQERLGFSVIGIIPSVGDGGARGGLRWLRGLFYAGRSGYYY